jgi:hypothetical protein
MRSFAMPLMFAVLCAHSTGFQRQEGRQSAGRAAEQSGRPAAKERAQATLAQDHQPLSALSNVRGSSRGHGTNS